jgi:hypothetical protein
MKNNLTKISVSHITILTILNFLALPTWASGPKEEMPELEKGETSPQRRSRAPSLPPKNNWMNAQKVPRTGKPSRNNDEPYLQRSKSFPPTSEDIASKPAPRILVLQQEKESEPNQTTTSENEENTLPKPILITLTPERKKRSRKPWRKSFSSFSPSSISGMKVIPTRGRPCTQPNSARESAETTRKWRNSTHLPQSRTVNLMLDSRTREVSDQSEVVEEKDQYTQPELLSCMRDLEQEDLESNFQLGWAYYIGEGRIMDRKQAVHLFKLGSKEGYEPSEAALAHCYDKGEGIQQNYKKAMKWSWKAAKKGNAHAQYRLGNYYYHGRGVTPDKKQAKEWYLEAAEGGHLMAQVELGSYYLFDEPFENDEQKYENQEQAMMWLQKAAEQGNEHAKILLEELKQTIEDGKESKNDKETIGSE